MPTYQYACTECGHAFEQFQSFTDDALTTCPQCRGRLRKVFNAVGVVFKGSGFYRTDSRTAARANGGPGTADKPADKPAAKGEAAAAKGSGDGAKGGSSATPAAATSGSSSGSGSSSAKGTSAA